MSLHARFDRALARVTTPFARLYPDGFGADLDARVAGVRDYLGPAAPLDIAWSAPRRRLGIDVRRGTFTSPGADYLPEESRVGIVERWSPHPDAPVCLVLAATAEEGFARRRPFARWLAHHGIGAVILENPFYGARRPAAQRGPILRTVADQFAMNLATVEESAALLRTFHDEGLEVGVTGYSQGGVMAAFAAAVSDFSVVAIPRGACRSAGPIFVDGALARAMAWDVLAAEAGSIDAAKEAFRAALEPVRLDRYPAPRDPSRAILVASREDGFIPEAEVRALHTHWPGSRIAWIDAGHFTGLVLHHHVHRRAVLDAFGRDASGGDAPGSAP